MPDTQDFVVVYRYDYWDADENRMVTSQAEATLECIRNGLGIPVIQSGRKVPRTAVDDRGRLIAADRQQKHVSPKG
jgi:hypothetical protein